MSHLHQLLRHPPNAIGRRGAVLLMLGLAWAAVGVNVAVGPPPFRPPGIVYLFELIPQPVRIAGWVGTAVVGVVCAFRRTPGDDAAGYVALVIMPLTRLAGYAWSAVLYAVGPAGTGSPSAAGSAVVWAVVVGLVLTIAGWEEYPPYIPPAKGTRRWRR